MTMNPLDGGNRSMLSSTGEDALLKFLKQVENPTITLRTDEKGLDAYIDVLYKAGYTQIIINQDNDSIVVEGQNPEQFDHTARPGGLFENEESL